MSSHSSLATTTETRALELLGSGVGPEQVAAALGVTTSRISQFLADPEFSEQVTALRYKNLLKHNSRDAEYDSLEDMLIERMKNIIPFMHKPFEIMRALTTVNSAKRRGASAPEQLTQSQTVIQLNMPVQIIQHFQKNTVNQVIKAGDQDLITVQSGRMQSLLSSSLEKGNQYVLPQPQGTKTPSTSS